MTTSCFNNHNVEGKALALGKWANLFMAFAGILTAWLSRSDAMMLDGLYSAVNFVSAVAAARIGARVGLPPTRNRPWGHDFDEVLYVTFRSLILIGVLIFTIVVSSAKIWTFFSGGTVPELIFGPIAVYTVVIVLICLALTLNYQRAYRKTGSKSAILKTEMHAALIDCALSFGAGAALLSLPFLKDTALGPYIPIGDAIIVLVLTLAIFRQPLITFRTTLSDLAGVSAPGSTHAKVSRAAREHANRTNYKLQRVAVLRAGRMHYAAIYLDPKRAVQAEEIDAFQLDLSNHLERIVGPTRVEVIITARGKISSSQNALAE